MPSLDERKDFRKWRDTCSSIVSKPFPPESSDFDDETLASDAKLNFATMSTWAIVCQEVLDTEHSHVYQRKCYEELRRRGKSDADIYQMREFAWHTAGWLNFPMMLWEWAFLDEKDIRHAIDLLHDESQVSTSERQRMLDFLQTHA